MLADDHGEQGIAVGAVVRTVVQVAVVVEPPDEVIGLGGRVQAVGAFDEDGSARQVNGANDNRAGGSGAAYVFTRAGTTWSQQAYIKPSNVETQDAFGVDVALSDDGTTLLVGSLDEDCAATTVNAPGCDTDWRRRYIGRSQHPETDAEKLRAQGDRVLELSRRIPSEAATGEFIGVMKLSPRGASLFLSAFDAARSSYPFEVTSNRTSLPSSCFTFGSFKMSRAYA